MRLIFVMNVFNEANYIKKAIESIHEIADEIWVYDGAYKQYPHEKPYSTDGTIEIAKSFEKVKVFETDVAYENQIVKRTKMFENAREGDYIFKLDGDEYITNPERIREFLDKGYDVIWGWTLSNLYSKPTMITRIFKYQKGLHYAGRHHWLFNGNKEFITSDQYRNPKFKHFQSPIRIFNFRDSSNTVRKKDKYSFLEQRNPEEYKFIKENKVYSRYLELVPVLNRAGTPRKATAILRDTVLKPDFTFSLMICRPWAMDTYFNWLKDAILPEGTIEAVVVVDSKDRQMLDRVSREFVNDQRFCNVKIYFTNNDKLPEFKQVSERRQRIVDNWHIILTEMRGAILLASEDDSIPDRNAYINLLCRAGTMGADFVQANIIGRWGVKLCPAWQIMTREEIPHIMWNLKEKKKGYNDIHGCGWYCFVCSADMARKEQMYVDDFTPLGPDIRFGYNLHKAGYRLVHDWDVKVKHILEDGSYLLPGNDKTEQRIWYKDLRGRQWKTINYTEELLSTLKKRCDVV